MMTTPGLSDDPVAISILQDPELLVHMENGDTVRRFVHSTQISEEVSRKIVGSF